MSQGPKDKFHERGEICVRWQACWKACCEIYKKNPRVLKYINNKNSAKTIQRIVSSDYVFHLAIMSTIVGNFPILYKHKSNAITSLYFVRGYGIN